VTREGAAPRELPVPRELTVVAPGVLVATAGLYVTTSTVVVGAAGGCLLVDPAVTVAEVAGLAAALAGRGLRAQAGWATHAHWDHVLWGAGLGGVPRYATPRTVATVRQERQGLIDGVTAAAPGHDLALLGALTAWHGDRVDWDGPEALVVEHDAHEPGHGAVYLPGTRTLLAGDMLSDVEIPLLHAPSPDPAGAYLAGLDRLAALDVQVVVPGHGHPGDGADFRRRLAADRGYVDALIRGSAAAGADERIGTSWLRAEHDRQFALLHA
jgi:hydroxyacylglutathione hydrolase